MTVFKARRKCVLCGDLKWVRHQDKLLLSLKTFDFQQVVTNIRPVWDA